MLIPLSIVLVNDRSCNTCVNNDNFSDNNDHCSLVKINRESDSVKNCNSLNGRP